MHVSCQKIESGNDNAITQLEFSSQSSNYTISRQRETSQIFPDFLYVREKLFNKVSLQNPTSIAEMTSQKDNNGAGELEARDIGGRGRGRGERGRG